MTEDYYRPAERVASGCGYALIIIACAIAGGLIGVVIFSVIA